MPLITQSFSKKLGNSKSSITKVETVKKEVGKEELIEYYSKVRGLLPNERAFKVWMMDFMRLGGEKGGKPICPVPFFTKRINDLAEWESAASKYNSLPFKGGFLDQPLFVIEAFNVIRAADNLYNSKKMENMKKAGKSKPSDKKKIRRRR